ncbi:hypothetical protein V2J09_009590, partial [Rumex salicifolius]
QSELDHLILKTQSIASFIQRERETGKNGGNGVDFAVVIEISSLFSCFTTFNSNLPWMNRIPPYEDEPIEAELVLFDFVLRNPPYPSANQKRCRFKLAALSSRHSRGQGLQDEDSQGVGEEI